MGINYICISDLHLGEEDNLITAIKNKKVDSNNLSNVSKSLIEALADLLGKINHKEETTIILSGDIIELALSGMKEALESFRSILLYLIGKIPLREIIYISGNHDHHIREIAREEFFL